MNIFIVLLIALIYSLKQIDAISDLKVEKSPELVKLTKLLHKRAEKIKAFPRLHRPVLA